MTNLKKKALLNFKKAQSHIAKIRHMIEEDQYCIDIMQQNLAALGLLKSAHQILMENHLQTCFTSAINTNNNAKKRVMTKEILQVTKLFNK